ncbi:MAG: hypothetical protein IJV54_15350 [Bacteroidales bacterium]|nr:hypothetical protein [Bacteroidales bacterium]
MDKDLTKFIKRVITLLLVVGLFVTAALTKPDLAKHRKVLTESVRKELRQQVVPSAEGNPLLEILLSGASSVGAGVASLAAWLTMYTKDYVFFNLGYVSESDGPLTLGILGQVIVFPWVRD